MASTPDVAAIAMSVAGQSAEVKAIMPAGADVHSFTVSSQEVRRLQRTVLVLFANSADLAFEQTIKDALGKTPALDWPDYEAQGAALGNYPGYPRNPHGPWLKLDNAEAMARAMAQKMIALGLPRTVIETNLHSFSRELSAMKRDYVALAEHRQLDKPLLVVIPGLCDLVANMNVPVASVLMAEGSGTVSGRELSEAVRKLRSGEFGGIVCPISMKQSKAGEAARQVAADSGTQIAYVRFQDTDLARETYLSVAAYNAAALSALGGGEAGTGGRSLRSPSVMQMAVIALATLIIGLIAGRALGFRRPPVCGAGIFDHNNES
jgi:ABC-type Zn uptake system ZnuABC Zn-binding protein ZnuA